MSGAMSAALSFFTHREVEALEQVATRRATGTLDQTAGPWRRSSGVGENKPPFRMAAGRA